MRGKGSEDNYIGRWTIIYFYFHSYNLLSKVYSMLIYYKMLTKNNIICIIHFFKLLKLLYVFFRVNKDNIQVKLIKNIFPTYIFK